MKNLKVTLIQADLAWHSVKENLGSFNSIISSIDTETDIVFLPEMFSTGFTMRPHNLAEDMNGRAVSSMLEWAALLNAFIAGSIIIIENGHFYNRLVIAGPDGGLRYYNKRHLFRMSGEHEVYTAGDENITVDIKGWRLRPFICYDLRFPVWTRNTGSAYDIVFFAANWPDSRSSHWEALLRARAIENQCYVVGVNRTGIDGNGVKYSGGSAIIDYGGNLVFSAGSASCMHTDELSHIKMEEYRKGFPAWMDADRFTLE